MEKKKAGRPLRQRWDGPEDPNEENLTLKKRENLDYDKALWQNTNNRFNFSFDDLPIKDRPGGDKYVFQKNIEFLIKHKRMKPVTVAEEAGISFDLLRKWIDNGLGQPQKRSWDSIDRLRKLFWLNSMAELWSDNLIHSLKQTERREAQMHPFLRNKDWPYAIKFMELLQSGEHDFLRDLIDRLSERELKIAGNSYQEGQGEEDRASPEDMAERF